MINFEQLQKKLWIGTLLINILFIGITLIWAPKFLFYLVFGMGLGVFQLWSLIFAAKYPKKKIQVVFSLTRMFLLAYLIVSVSHAHIVEATVVICGLLSYKVILTIESIRYALPGFRWKKNLSVNAAERQKPGYIE